MWSIACSPNSHALKRSISVLPSGTERMRAKAVAAMASDDLWTQASGYQQAGSPDLADAVPFAPGAIGSERILRDAMGQCQAEPVAQ